CVDGSARSQFLTLSLHDALPISIDAVAVPNAVDAIKAVTKTRLKLADLPAPPAQMNPVAVVLMYRMIGLSNKDIAIAIGISVKQDRKSTRLNSSHVKISYAVFCL